VDTNLWLWIGMAATAVGALFATLQMCVREATRAGLTEIAERKRKPGPARRIEKIMADPEGHAVAAALPRIVLNLLVVVALMEWITQINGAQTAGTTEIILSLAVAAVAIWMFGMVIPWSVAEHAADPTVYVWSIVIRGSYIALRPVLGLARFLEEVVRRLLGAQHPDSDEAREAELLSVVEEGELAGQFDETERDMIEAVVEFRSSTVDQIMTPRTEIEAIKVTDDLDQVTRICRESGHSRVPVYEGDLDHIVGIFYVKDMLSWISADGAKGDRASFDLRALLREASFVPETKTVRELLAELLRKRVHIAIVADEYGGTAGLVTIEDIVEEVFGEIQDEYEGPDDEPPGVSIDTEKREAQIDARADIDDVNDELEALGVALPESEEYETVGGYIVTALGRIPEKGDTLTHNHAVITVLDAEPTRVNRIRLVVHDNPDNEGETRHTDEVAK
jgi:magnesium and cobalt exporter, CNNM family